MDDSLSIWLRGPETPVGVALRGVPWSRPQSGTARCEIKELLGTQALDGRGWGTENLPLSDSPTRQLA